MAYYVGDIPAEDIVIDPARDGEPIDLAPFDELDSTGELRTFEGDVVDADFLITFDGDPVDQIVLEWPATTVFATPGLYTLTVTLIGDTAREKLAPVYIVAQEDNGWHTLDSARDEWGVGHAPQSDRRLFQMLELARQQVAAYAPALDDDAAVPLNYRQGQLMQAVNLYNAARVDPASGGDADDEFVLRPYPLDWMVKQVLRPARAVKVVR